MQKKRDLQEIVNILDKYKVRDQIEILANIFINQGTALMGWESGLKASELIAKLTKYKRENKETLPSALVNQGVVLMIWLEKDIGELDE
jgi:hypothetical protein